MHSSQDYLCLKVSDSALPHKQRQACSPQESPGDSCSSAQGPALPSPRCWEGALPHHRGDAHFRGHRWQWDRRTRHLSTFLGSGLAATAAPPSNACWSILQPMAMNSEHAGDRFYISVGNEIQSHTNNCVCFPHGFQSGITSYRKSQMLIKFASPLISSAVTCKFLSWMGAANLNTWCVPVLSEPDQNWGEQVYLT